MALSPGSGIGHVRATLIHLLKGYFTDLRFKEIDLDTKLHDLELGDTWLIEYIFIVEAHYSLDISDEMARKHFIRIRNAAKYLVGRNI